MMSSAPDLSELAQVSARIGADPLLIQGPGGNTSLKGGNALWVKASGIWLSEAVKRPIFAGLSLDAMRQIQEAGRGEDFSSALLPGADPRLRPSIETALHAFMPHRAVLHAHAANSMAVSVLEAGKDVAARALAGLDWAWIPYARPGTELAASVRAALSVHAADILLLQNHGVVVGADSPLAAEALLRDVERRLNSPPRAYPSADPAIAMAKETARYQALANLSALAVDAYLIEIATGAALFPDQVVFLGGAVPGLAEGETLDSAADRVAEATGVPPALLIWPEVGAFADRTRTAAATALIEGLFEVVRRIPAGARVRGLADEDVAALLGWEAEAYRISLARRDRP